MIRRLIILLLIVGCAAINIKCNRNDDKNLIIKTETLFNNAIIVENREYYTNGNMKEEFIFRDGQISFVKEYYKDGKLKNQFNISDSTYIEYDENGVVVGKVVDGVQTIKNSSQITPKLEIDN